LIPTDFLDQLLLAIYDKAHSGSYYALEHKDLPFAGTNDSMKIAGSIGLLRQQGLIDRVEKSDVFPCHVRSNGNGFMRVARELRPVHPPMASAASSATASLPDLEPVLEILDNREFVRQLVDQLRGRGSIIPFVGAGLSIPFNFPGWTSFLLDEANKAAVKSDVGKLLKLGNYEEAAELVEARRTPIIFQRAMQGAFGDHKLPSSPISGAVAYLPQLTNGPVLTTNFDRLLERVYGDRFEVVIEGAQPDRINDLITSRKTGLLKLHGSFDERSTRVLTKSEYDKHYGSLSGGIDMSLPLPRLLAHILSGHRLLFVGSSLNADRTVSALAEVAKTAPESYHFGIVELPSSKRAQAQRASLLGAAGIVPIWYPTGEHHWVEQMLKYLVSEVAKHP